MEARKIYEERSVTTWFVFSGVVTLVVCFLALGGLIDANSFNYYTKDYQSWFFFDSSFLWVMVTIAIAKVFTFISDIGMRVYTSISNKSFEDFPQLWFWFFTAYGLLLVWLYPLVVTWYETGPTSEDVFVGLFQLLLMIPVGLLIVLPLFFLNLLYSIFGAPVMLFGLIAQFPFFFIGIYSFFVGGSRTSRIAERHAKTRRPNDQIEEELARAMQSGEKSDDELRNIISEFGPIRRFFHIMTYKKEAEKYRDVRDFMNAQREAMREEAEMADTAHEFERDKRRYE